MNKRFSMVSGLLTLVLILMICLPAYALDSPTKAVTKGDWAVSFRWRLETVDQDPLPHNATTIPLRARVSYTTANWSGFSAKAEVDFVTNFGLDNFNAGGGNTPNPPGYPVIADPTGEDLNQVYLQYQAGFGGQFRVGRQRIIYDNSRFIGNVGWRQNEQTYDAFTFTQKTAGGFNLQYAYVDKVHRIFGNDVAAGEHGQSTHLLNLAYGIKDFGKLTLYYYDIDNDDVAGFSNTTWGVRWHGSHGTSGPKLGYGVEFASQQDNADNPVAYAADYWRFDLSAAFSKATVYVGYESLEGDQNRPGQAFRTPLATLHAMNGWADKFLATPAAGLNDAYAGVKGTLGKWKWNVLYHDFSAQSGSADYGSEIDASIARKFKQNFSVLLKAARFDTDSPAFGDTNKFWLQLTASY